jgi:REP element-mobilizing transposase RayT
MGPRVWGQVLQSHILSSKEEWGSGPAITLIPQDSLIHGIVFSHDRHQTAGMTRPLRLELAGGFYHVTSRGDRRENIYSDDNDRQIWLRIFAETCERFNWVCHAWCLMGNHYHIVIETVEANLAHGMRHLNGVFTQVTNKLHRRVGHLFQGRYKAILVEKDSHLLELSRYVVLNPVRAGMVVDVADWPWSSWHSMCGTTPSPDWLRTDWILTPFGNTRSAAITAYAEFVRAGLGQPSIWSKLKGQIYLGSETFAQQMQASVAQEDLTEIPRAQRRAKALTLAEYQATSENKHVAMARAYASGDYTMQVIAKHFNVHYATVSRAVRQIQLTRKCA